MAQRYAFSKIDISSASDTIDHLILFFNIIFKYYFHLHSDILHTVLKWSRYLNDWKQPKSIPGYCSAPVPLHLNVHRDSFFHSIIFIIYVKSLSTVINSHCITHKCIADGLQL